MRALELTLAGLVLATGATAQELSDIVDGVGRAVELPAHRALMDHIAEDGVALEAFTTDGCSGGMSTIWSFVAEQSPKFAELHSDAPPWIDCCTIHDRAYHNASGAAEAEQSFAARLAVDEALRVCVSATAAQEAENLGDAYDADEETVQGAFDAIAGAMFHAVRLGGGPCSGLPWRWGYGYPQCPTIFD